MSFLAWGVLLLWITNFVKSEDKSGDYDFSPVQDSSELETRGLNPFDVVKKFNMCYLKCNGKHCICCQKIRILLIHVEVCGTIQVQPAEGIIDIGLTVSGVRLAGTIVKMNKLAHFCKSLKSKIGQIEVCVDSSISEHQDHPNSFNFCAQAVVSYQGAPSLHVKLTCVELSGDITIDGDGGHGARTMAVIKILNGDQIASAVLKV